MDTKSDETKSIHILAGEQLADAVSLANSRPLTDLESLGLNLRFRVAFRFACDAIRSQLGDLLGMPFKSPPRDLITTAFQYGILGDLQGWLSMMEDNSLAFEGPQNSQFINLQSRIETIHSSVLTNFLMATNALKSGFKN